MSTEIPRRSAPQPLAIATFLFAAPPILYAQTPPRTMSCQGIPADANGAFVADGQHSLQLKLYDALTGGSEVHNETQSVIVVKGVFNVLIGTSTPIALSLMFDRPYYLGVSVDGGAELTPRTPLTSAPYSFRATTAAAADLAAALQPGAPNVVSSINGQSGELIFEGSGATTVTRNGG